MNVYLDNNATTALDPRVLDAMLADLGPPLNPSSVHRWGQKAKVLLNQARTKISSYLGCIPSELIFTSGGSEGLNMLIRGLYRGGKILTSPLEHSAVLKTLQDLPTIYTPAEDVEKAITPEVSLMVFSAVNGETGSRADLEHLAQVADFHRIPLIVDGVALLGRGQVKLYPGVSAMAFSAHKLHGPKGVGAVFLAKNHRLNPLIRGGSQEHQLRAGTENLAGIIGFAKAVELIDPTDFVKIEMLRDGFESKLDVLVNGSGSRICNVSNVAFDGIDGEALLMQLDQAGIAASHGSACSSGALEPSHVLQGLGYSQERIRSSIRFSLSRFTTQDEIDYVVKALSQLTVRMRTVLAPSSDVS